MPKRLAVVMVLLVGVTGLLPAQVAPDAEWRTLESEHFRVTYGPGLEPLAARAAAVGETTYERLSRDLARPPRGKVDVLVTDFADFSNGSATVFPSNRIVLYARPPVDELSLSHFEDWIELVMIHELTHVFHTDLTGPVGRAVRGVFGRVPLPWPVFPAIGGPKWSLEGLATVFESAYTGAGRVHGSYHEMVVRTAILEDAFESIDRMSGTSPAWPGQSRVYIYGSKFLDYVARTRGPEALAEVVEKTATALVPPSLSFDRIGKRALGESFTDLHAEWRRELEATYRRLADSLRAEGLTSSERVAGAGYLAGFPRVGPNGWVAYVSSDGKNSPAARVFDPETGVDRRLARRNSIGPVSWLPDGRMITAQTEFLDPYRIVSDLYRVGTDGSEERLTRGARLDQPDVSPDGRHVVAVEVGDGTNRLVIFDLETREVRPLMTALPDVHWAYPRWSPDGERIAAVRWRAGAFHDVVILDARGTVIHEVTRDRAVDTGPTWSPDGRYVLFSSDRTGIANLFAIDLQAGMKAAGDTTTLWQVTNVLTGAFHPEVSQDGRWIYFTGYHADGFAIERIPFDPSSWRPAAPAREELADGDRGTRKAVPDVPLEPSRPYSPVQSMLPRYWFPSYDKSSVTGTFLGLATGGNDLVGRHSWAMAARYAPGERLFEGAAAYSYAGLGNPVLTVSASRDWDGFHFQSQGEPARMLEVEDVVDVSASLLHQRWRRAALLDVGAEWVTRRYEVRDAPRLRVRDPRDDLFGVWVSAAFANDQRHAFSISREDGVSATATIRRRWDLDPHRTDEGTLLDRGYDEALARVSAYKSIPLFGFANHVIAARGSARLRAGAAPGLFGIGGTTASGIDTFVGRVGGTSLLLPVRGFDEDTRLGTRAWTASLEYRVPLASIGRGYRLWPVFLDRLSGAAFVDAGNAWCTPAQQETLAGCGDIGANDLLVSAGAELGLDVTLFYAGALHLRLGVATPLQGPDSGTRLYLQAGPSF